MTRVQSVNLEWHIVESGLYRIGRHAVSNTGEIATAFRDNLADRTYCLITYSTGAHAEPDAEVGGTFAIDALRTLEVVPKGGFSLAATDDDLYFMNTSAARIDRTAYQPGRGMMFVDIALAAADSRRTFAILSMDRTGDNYTLSAAEGSDSLVSLWAKTWMSRVTSIGISSSGEWFAAGLANGRLVVMDRSRQIVWEHMPDADEETPPTVVSIAIADEGTVIAIDEAGAVRRHAPTDGHILWRHSLSEILRDGAASHQTDYTVACDASASVIGVTNVASVTLKSGKQSAESSYAFIDGDSGSFIWHDRLPSAATGIAVSPNGGHAAVSCRGGDLLSFSIRLSRATGFRATAHQFALAQAMFDEARAAAEAEQFADAIPLLDEALALNPTHPGATVLFDDVVWHLRNEVLKTTTAVTEENLAAAQAALELIPCDEKLTIRRNALARLVAEKLSADAMALEHEGREEEAIPLFARAVKIDRTNFEIRMALKNVQDKLIRGLFQESQSRMAGHDYQGAIDLLEKVRSLRPDEPGVDDRLTFSYANLAFSMGMQHYNSRRYPQAAFQFRRTLLLQKENMEAARYLRMAEAAARQASGAASKVQAKSDEPEGDDTLPEEQVAVIAEPGASPSRTGAMRLHRSAPRPRRVFPR